MRTPRHALGLLAALGAAASLATAHAGEFLLVRRSMDVQPIRLTAIEEQQLIHLPPDSDYQRVPLDDCIALLNPKAAPATRTRGLLTLADGQRLPGQVTPSAETQANALAWSHPWLGRIDVPLDHIQSILLTPTAVAPPTTESDVVLLSNGDRQEGLINSLGESISIEVERGGTLQNIEIPLDVVAAVSIIPSQREPAGRRIWFEEGTIIDVQSISVSDDGFVRLTGSWLASGTQPTLRLSQIAAILLDPHGMIPLATLPSTRVEGPPTRYVLPRPHALDPGAPLDLSRLEYRGPLIARYALPAACQRFTAEAELPREAHAWGDFELVIRSNDDEVFRQTLNAATPAASINVPVTGRELTIELLAGAHGPIQDQLILHRAMLLKGR